MTGIQDPSKTECRKPLLEVVEVVKVELEVVMVELAMEWLVVV